MTRTSVLYASTRIDVWFQCLADASTRVILVLVTSQIAFNAEDWQNSRLKCTADWCTCGRSPVVDKSIPKKRARIKVKTEPT